MPASFEPDDAQLLSLLLDTPSSGCDGDAVAEVAERLNGDGGGLAGRILADFGDGPGGTSTWWDGLTTSVEGLGLPPPSQVSTPPSHNASNPSGGGGGGEEDLPAAFQTPAGRLHLAATRALLGVDQGRAVGLTLATLRMLAERHDDNDSNNTTSNGGDGGGGDNGNGGDAGGEEKKDDNDGGNGDDAASASRRCKPTLRNLLGTRSLLTAVRSYHFAQKVARLRLLAECLRLDSDSSDDDNNGGDDDNGGGAIREAARTVLDGLDRTLVHDGERRRGLLRLLLGVATSAASASSAASAGGRIPTREELMSAMQLRTAFERMDPERSGGVKCDIVIEPSEHHTDNQRRFSFIFFAYR